MAVQVEGNFDLYRFFYFLGGSIMERMEALTNYYTTHKEDARLALKRGMVEFLTTIHYVEKYLKPGMRILEIGAGTGRYSHYFAQNGYDVDAWKLWNAILKSLRRIRRMEKILTNIASDQYDITLLLGPMYHLYTEDDQLAAMSEAIRVTKKGGIVFAAYCNNDITVYHFGFLRGGFNTGERNELIDFETFKLKSTPKEVFALYRQEDVNELMSHFINRTAYKAYKHIGSYIVQPFDVEMTHQLVNVFLPIKCKHFFRCRLKFECFKVY